MINQNLPAQAPFSQEAEEALLGCILLDPIRFTDIAEFLQASDFFLKRHECVWQAFTNLNTRREPIDYLTVTTELKTMHLIEEIGGQAFLTYLVNNVPSSVHAEIYGRLVERAAIRRKMLYATDTIRKMALDEETPIHDILAESESIIFALHDRNPLHRSRSALEVANAVYEQVERGSDVMAVNPKYISGIATGFSLLDWTLDGIPRGYVSTFAGQTGIGKTAFIGNVALNAAKMGINREIKAPARVVIFSGEMVEDDLFRRMTSMLCGINSRDIRRGFAPTPQGQAQQAKALNAISDLSGLPITFESGQRLTTAGLRSVVRRHIGDGNVLFILDSILQIDPSKSAKQQDKDWLKINTIMEELEDIALTYNAAILCTTQLNRDGYSNKTKPGAIPTLANLKRASAIEEKSANVILMYWSGKEDQHGNPMIAFNIAKSRFGENKIIDFVFNDTLTQFHEVDYRVTSNDVMSPHYTNDL